ncbi:tyrosine recombinase XerC [Chloroflexota bacterium]
MGHLRQRTKGSWQICVYGGYVNGQAVRNHETVKGTKTDAVRRMRELESGLDKGVPIPVGKLTVAEHLHNWLEGYARTACSQRTVDGYESIVENHLIPALGHIQLKQLQPQAIQVYYSKTMDKAGKGLSSRTVQKHHRLLSQSLRYAVRQGILGRNICELVVAPSWKGKTMRTLTPAEAEVLLETASGDQFYPVIYTALSTGLRQAELLGLRWRDIDLDMLSVSVNQTLYKRRGVCTFQQPKTEHSRRRVAMTPKLALFLRDYRKEREVLYLELGTVLGLDDLVFSNYDGRPTDPSMLSHEFARIVTRAGLEHVRFHDLRHTFASLALLRGAKPKVISEALGHSSVAFTMDVYSHIIEGMQSEMMALLDEVLPYGVARAERTPETVGMNE